MATPNDSAILKKSRPATSVLDFQREEILSFLRERLLRHQIKNAYLFGSFARGEAEAWSDLDVIIIADTCTPFVDRPKAFLDLYDLGIPVDILVYTLEEWDSVEKHGKGFSKEMRKDMITLV